MTAAFSQFGNTCYANSVLQALYFCKPFREKVLAHRKEELDLPNAADKGDNESLLSILGDLFVQIATYRRKYGVIHPRRFMSKVKKENGKFMSVYVASQIMSGTHANTKLNASSATPYA